jgi:hypothetical protein
MLKDNIEMDVNVVMLKIVGRIHLAQDRDTYHPLVNMVMNLWVPQNAGKFSTS